MSWTNEYHSVSPPRGRDRRAAADAAEDAAELRRNRAAMPEARARQRRDVARSAPSPAPAAAVDLTAGADFVVPPVRQSYKQRISGCRRAPEDAGRV